MGISAFALPLVAAAVPSAPDTQPCIAALSPAAPSAAEAQIPAPNTGFAKVRLVTGGLPAIAPGPDAAGLDAPDPDAPAPGASDPGASAPGAVQLPAEAGDGAPPAQAPEQGVPAGTDTRNEPPAATGQSEIVVTGRAPYAGDPVQALNVESYKVIQALDGAVVGPIAHTYMDVVPEPVRDGIHNALNNLDEPIVFANFVLQLKPGKALETLGRFVINSTLGVGGLFDVARKKPFNLPRRSNGLADTLGYYGVGPGPYFFLPVLGSTTLRDLIARPFDLALVPFVFGNPFNDPTFATSKSVLSALDEREQMDGPINSIRASKDSYAAMRSWYLRKRQAEIDVLKGKRENADVPVIEDEQAPPPPAPTAASPADGTVAPPPPADSLTAPGRPATPQSGLDSDRHFAAWAPPAALRQRSCDRVTLVSLDEPARAE